MADVPDYLLVHSITVETYAGTGAYGDTFAAPVQIRCFVDDQRKNVLAPDGSTVVSESTVIAKLTDAIKLAAKSKVTLPSGRHAIVINAKRRDDGGLGAPQHVEVVCT